MKVRSARFCSVSQCHSVDDGSVAFHGFPKCGTKIMFRHITNRVFYCDTRKVWKDRVGADQKINKHSKICSKHFTEDDYTSGSKINRRLKKTAVPTVNLPSDVCSGFNHFDQKPQEVFKNSNIQQRTHEDTPDRDTEYTSSSNGSIQKTSTSGETNSEIIQSITSLNPATPEDYIAKNSKLCLDDLKKLENGVITDDDKDKIERILDELLMYTCYEFEQLKSTLIRNN